MSFSYLIPQDNPFLAINNSREYIADQTHSLSEVIKTAKNNKDYALTAYEFYIKQDFLRKEGPERDVMLKILDEKLFPVLEDLYKNKKINFYEMLKCHFHLPERVNKDVEKIKAYVKEIILTKNNQQVHNFYQPIRSFLVSQKVEQKFLIEVESQMSGEKLNLNLFDLKYLFGELLPASVIDNNKWVVDFTYDKLLILNKSINREWLLLKEYFILLSLPLININKNSLASFIKKHIFNIIKDKTEPEIKTIRSWLSLIIPNLSNEIIKTLFFDLSDFIGDIKSIDSTMIVNYCDYHEVTALLNEAPSHLVLSKNANRIFDNLEDECFPKVQILHLMGTDISVDLIYKVLKVFPSLKTLILARSLNQEIADVLDNRIVNLIIQGDIEPLSKPLNIECIVSCGANKNVDLLGIDAKTKIFHVSDVVEGLDLSDYTNLPMDVIQAIVVGYEKVILDGLKLNENIISTLSIADIRELSINHCSGLTIKTMHALKSAKKLERLSMDGLFYDQTMLDDLFPKLKYLSINGCKCPDTPLCKSEAVYHSLEGICFDSDCSPHMLQVISKSQVKIMDIEVSQEIDLKSMLIALRDNLEKLILRGNDFLVPQNAKFDTQNTPQIKALKELVFVEFKKLNLTKSLWDLRFPALEILTLENCEGNEEDYSTFFDQIKFPQLKKVFIKDAKATDRTLIHIFAKLNKTIECLGIQGSSNVSPLAVEMLLMQCENLKYFALNESALITQEVIARLATKYPHVKLVCVSNEDASVPMDLGD